MEKKVIRTTTPFQEEPLREVSTEKKKKKKSSPNDEALATSAKKIVSSLNSLPQRGVNWGFILRGGIESTHLPISIQNQSWSIPAIPSNEKR